jgi:hypothetical protein
MRDRVLDDFEDLSTWAAITSGQAQLKISQDHGFQGKAMRLDFDFRGGGGFVVARKEFALEIPETYTFEFHVRGHAPPNILEFKLVDGTNQNVWRYRVEAFDFPEKWQPLKIRSSQIGFAWGPLGGGAPRRIAAIELVIAAGPGGNGTVWIDRLWFRDETYRLTPMVQASSALPGHGPQNAVTPSQSGTWRSEASDKPQWFLIDFKQQREYGGLVIEWLKDFRPRRFAVQVSLDGTAWATLYSTAQADSERSYIYLPQTISRYIRLNLLQSTRGRGFGIQSIEVKPYDFSRTIHHFFQNIARDEAPGHYPKYLLGRQTYWTTVGTAEGGTQALMNEEGMVEVDKGSFSVEPFLYADDRLVTWADALLSQELEKGYLPVPSSEWRTDRYAVKVTAFASGQPGRPLLYLRYRVANKTKERRPVRLFTAIRPFQVTPTWQNWRSFGGMSPVREMYFREGALTVNGEKVVIPLTPPSGFGAAPFAAGGVTGYLIRGELPPWTEVSDEFGCGSGAFRFDLDLSPGSEGDVFLLIPWSLEKGAIKSASGPKAFEHAIRAWEAKLGAVSIRVPDKARALADTFRTAAAHILINRDGPALHPGPRRYNRSWIRDGAIMGAALLRAGFPEVIRDFIRWYAGYQGDEGNVPDCVDAEGAEWLPEFDAYGEFIFAVVEYYRFTSDKAFLEEMQPAVAKALAFMEGLRNKRLTEEYRTPEKKAFYGLLPESMSHEGYMAHPVHAFWDDFWAIRGVRDAALMAKVLDDAAEGERLASLRDSFSEDVRASLIATITNHRIDFVPGSVEFGDFDPTATSIAIAMLDEGHLLPPAETANTFDRYLAGFRERARGETAWNNYSAYEIRIIGALVRLGRRREALELAEFMLRDRRIPPWNQWPEISWRDPSGPSFMGDLPHTWISAEYILAVCSMFAYERESDQTLVIAAGVAEEWLSDGSTVGVESLPTYYGNLTYFLRMKSSDTLHLKLEGDLAVPPGGIVVRPPLPRPIRRVEINGIALAEFEPDCFRCGDYPAEAVVKF